MSWRNLVARLRAAWHVLRAPRVIVLSYDPRQPPHKLGRLHTCGCPSRELPARLYYAAEVAATDDWEDSQRGGAQALTLAKAILLRRRRPGTT